MARREAEDREGLLAFLGESDPCGIKVYAAQGGGDFR